jgi:hypothetical protein
MLDKGRERAEAVVDSGKVVAVWSGLAGSSDAPSPAVRLRGRPDMGWPSSGRRRHPQSRQSQRLAEVLAPLFRSVLPLDIEGRQAFGSADLAIAATAFTYELVLLNRIVPHFKFQVVKVVDPFNDQPDSLLELLPCPCGPSRSFPQNVVSSRGLVGRPRINPSLSGLPSKTRCRDTLPCLTWVVLHLPRQ